MTEAETQPSPEPRWLDETEDRAWRGLLRMIWLIEIGIGRDLMDEGLSSADYHVLANLSEAPGREMRITDLAARMGWSKSRLSHQLSRMQARGLVCRNTISTDGRGALAVLAPAGWEAIRKAAPGHVESIRRHLLGRLSPEQVEALAGITDAVLAGCAEKAEACDTAEAVAGCWVEEAGCSGDEAGLGEAEAELGAEA